MEPGHEDREYGKQLIHRAKPIVASMEPGHEDREYQSSRRYVCASPGLNGARS